MNALGMVYLKTAVTYSISSGPRKGSATLSILTPLRMFVVGKFYCPVFVGSISISILKSLQMLHGFLTVNILDYRMVFDRFYNIKGKYFAFLEACVSK